MNECSGIGQKKFCIQTRFITLKRRYSARAPLFYRALKGKVQQYNLEIPSKSGEVYLFQIKTFRLSLTEKGWHLWHRSRHY
ncbi:hypothetical protein JS44_00190 [Anoxybacillus flavithermus]|uniref:Uncharacterized protein n=1 Tax=Anoxybacillus flavithermus TaxID=33934 RepID=A0A094J3G4_9BACL|nr:hypothetical protein JS44_00190 [Anoxybacillus flavithermus]